MRLPIIATALLLLAAATAGAAPFRPVRDRVVRPAPAPAEPAALRPVRSVVDVCGTDLDAVPRLLVEHLSRDAVATLPTTYSTDAGGIAVLEDDGSFFYTDKNNQTLLDLASVAQAFYRTHGDDYDALAMYCVSGQAVWLGSAGALASANYVRNRTTGIGLDTFDYGEAMGSPARLKVILNMNGLQRYPDDPAQNFSSTDPFCALDVLAHEFGHQWLAYTFVDSAGHAEPSLLGRDYQHWNFFFDSDSSFMEGHDWVSVGPDSFRTDGAAGAFGRLDLYLMGLMAPSEIDSFFVVDNATDFDPPGSYLPGSPSLVGLGCHGDATWWRIADIQAVHGPRVPAAAAAQHDFRMAMILVTPHGVAPTAADLAKLEAIRSQFGPAYHTATGGRGTVDASLDSRAGSVRIVHTPLADTEDTVTPRAIGARVKVEQGGIPLALEPGSVRAFWRLAGGGSFNEVALAPAAADSFAGSLPAQPAGSAVEYYLYAPSDSAGIEAFDPPAGPAAPHTYAVGPDLTPPSIAHVAVTEQAADRMPQTLLARVTDNLGVEAVWGETSVDGGPLQITPAVPAGRDTFVAPIGAGVQAGHWIAYRIGARDAAAAHNAALFPASFDTLRVGATRVWEMENGTDGFLHQAQWYSYRDAWHPTQEDAWPGGATSWKCGAWDTTAYPPHLDACLYTPVLASLAPGTQLRFRHRYDLESFNDVYAWDGARVEGQVNGGAWQILPPVTPYSHRFPYQSNPFVLDAPVWSGSSNGWRTELVDLTPLAPGPARVRFRMLADDSYGYAGWYVDDIRIGPAAELASAPAAPPLAAVGRPWPNPARDVLRLSLALARPARAEWALYDVAGRRVAMLWSGRVPAGGAELRGALPALAPGLYLARLTIDGRPMATARVALLR